MIVSGVSPPPYLLREIQLRPLRVSELNAVRKLGGWRWKSIRNPRKGGSSICRAELIHDAPFAVAIGACVLNSLVFPIPSTGRGGDEEDGGGAINSTDARFAVMGIISFIPYFNWLSWVFAWMDSSSSRYLAYSLVYLAPYFRTNLSLSPEESWLPIASIFICILHIQLEASIRNGDVKPFSLLGREQDSEIEGKGDSFIKDSTKQRMKLPPRRGSRDVINEWRLPKKSGHDIELLKQDSHDTEQLKQDPEEDAPENKSK